MYTRSGGELRGRIAGLTAAMQKERLRRRNLMMMPNSANEPEPEQTDYLKQFQDNQSQNTPQQDSANKWYVAGSETPKTVEPILSPDSPDFGKEEYDQLRRKGFFQLSNAEDKEAAIGAYNQGKSDDDKIIDYQRTPSGGLKLLGGRMPTDDDITESLANRNIRMSSLNPDKIIRENRPQIAVPSPKMRAGKTRIIGGDRFSKAEKYLEGKTAREKEHARQEEIEDLKLREQKAKVLSAEEKLNQGPDKLDNLTFYQEELEYQLKEAKKAYDEVDKDVWGENDKEKAARERYESLATELDEINRQVLEQSKSFVTGIDVPQPRNRQNPSVNVRLQKYNKYKD